MAVVEACEAQSRAEQEADEEDCLEETIRQYVANGGTRCPYCQSEMIGHDGHPEFDHGNAHCQIRVTCDDCGEHWFSLFQLVGFCPA
jgi:hypothetical protein